MNNFTPTTTRERPAERHRLLDLSRIALTFILGILLAALPLVAGNGPTGALFDAPPKADLDQVRNGAADSPVSPGIWVNGNLNKQQAHYLEGQSVPYRTVMTDMPAGTVVTLTIEYDVKHSDKFALDYLTHYNRLQPHLAFGHGAEQIDPTDGTLLDNQPVTDTHPIPVPPVTATTPIAGMPQASFNALPANERLMSIWNGDITTIAYGPGPVADLSVAKSSQQVTITFTVSGNVGDAPKTVILAWGGHIASRLDWGYLPNGDPRSAGGINGSPYHLRLITWSLGNLGNQDRSLMADAVSLPECGGCDISGPHNVNACPGTTQQFTTTPPPNCGNPSIQWTISGDGEIIGATTGRTVTVKATNKCLGWYGIKATYSCTGCTGAPIECARIVDIADNTPPTINTPSNLIVCNANWPEYITTSWVDNCSPGGGTANGYPFGDIWTDGCKQFRNYKFIVVDACGNENSLIVKVTRIHDVTKPEIKPVADQLLQVCNAPWPEFLTTTWWDNCSPGGEVKGFPFGEIWTEGCKQFRNYKFAVTDACGNENSLIVKVSRTYDVTKPEIKHVDDYMLNVCNAPWPEFLTTTWWDNCSTGGEVKGYPFGEVWTEGCKQFRNYKFVVVDACGNENSRTVKLGRVYDVVKPEIKPVADYLLPGCSPNWPDYITTTWWDNCSSGGEVKGYPFGEIWNEGCKQFRTYKFVVVDACGNDNSLIVKVSRIYDLIKPEIKHVDDYILPGCSPNWPDYITTTWWDNCSPGGEVKGYPFGEIWNEGCKQFRTYKFVVVDACGNENWKVVKIGRIYDLIKPEIKHVDDYILPGCSPNWPDYITTTWWDNCSPGGEVKGYPFGEIWNEGCKQFRTYKFVVVDACGNENWKVVKIGRIYDLIKPEIKHVDDYMLNACNAPWPAHLTTTWWDNCSPGGEVKGYPFGEIWTEGCKQFRYYKFVVVDVCGNENWKTVKVGRIYDVIKPEIKHVSDYFLPGCSPAWPDHISTTWWDNCSPGGTVKGYPTGEIWTEGCKQFRTYKFQVADACGNENWLMVKIGRINDNVKPHITPIADYILPGCSPYWPDYITTTWSDNCSYGGTVKGYPTGEIWTEGCKQFRTYKFQVADACGNENWLMVKVGRINDNVKPYITPVHDYVLPGCSPYWPDYITTTWSDNCSYGGTVKGYPTGEIWSEGCKQFRYYKFQVSDACGNENWLTVKIARINDNVKPYITPVNDYILPGCSPNWPDYITTTWSDNCSYGGTVKGYPYGNVWNEGCKQFRNYKFQVADACGNENWLTVKIARINDNVKPYITPVADYTTYECNYVFPEYLSTSWSDNCSPGGTVKGYPHGNIEYANGGSTQIRTYKFHVTDACGNENWTTTKITRYCSPSTLNCPNLGANDLYCSAQIPCPSYIAPLVKSKVTSSCGQVNVTLIGDTGEPQCYNGTFSRTYTVKIQDPCGGYKECQITYSGNCYQFCTLTQGGWGNAGGKYPWNNAQGEAPTLDIIKHLMKTYGKDSLIVGNIKGGNSMILRSPECVLTLLPGQGNPSGILPAGDAIANNANDCHPYDDSYYGNNGRIKNSLVTQVITLQLNIWYNRYFNRKLGEYDLWSNCYNIPNLYLSSGLLGRFDANHDDKATVQELLDYVNKYLSGALGSNVGMSEQFNDIVSKLNEYWNDCAYRPTATGCRSGNLDGPVGGRSEESTDEEAIAPTAAPALSIFPNPAVDLLQVVYTVPAEKDMIVHVYAANGQLMQTYSWNALAGENKEQLDLTQLPNGLYWITLTDGDMVLTKRFVKAQH